MQIKKKQICSEHKKWPETKRYRKMCKWILRVRVACTFAHNATNNYKWWEIACTSCFTITHNRYPITPTDSY